MGYIAQGQEKFALPDSVSTNGVYASFKATANAKPKRIGIDETFGLTVTTVGKDLLFLSNRYWTVFESKKGKIKSVRHTEKYSLKTKKHLDSTYKFYFSLASDSVTDKRLLAAYISDPKTNNWKMLAYYPAPGYKQKLQQLTFSEKDFFDRMYNAKGWKKIDSSKLDAPALRPFVSIDSAKQHQLDLVKIKQQLKDSGATFKEGLFYKITKSTTGAQVALTDTVEVFYKGWTMDNNQIFDQTKDKPINFPLQRLIKGWQIAVVEAKVGETVRIWIPSSQAYGIRNSSASIPPNSILVFDVEVVGSKRK